MTTLQFTKMHGLGNDFVVIDGVRQEITITAELARRIADRHFGVGCDQVLLGSSGFGTGVEQGLAPGIKFRAGDIAASGSAAACCWN